MGQEGAKAEQEPRPASNKKSSAAATEKLPFRSERPNSNFSENNAVLNDAATAHHLAAVDILVGNVQKFILLLGVERGFPASCNGNG
jgi:hypothetical protein